MFEVEKYPRWAYEKNLTYGHCSAVGSFNSLERAQEEVDKEKYFEYRKKLKDKRQQEWFEKNKVEIVID
jgi:hypothetical protein